jgi:hypothetical protein
MSLIVNAQGHSQLASKDAPDATPGKVMASLNFYETPDGTMAIEGLHVGEFNPNIQQHRILEIIMQMLPQIVSPAEMPAIAEQTNESTEAMQ